MLFQRLRDLFLRSCSTPVAFVAVVLAAQSIAGCGGDGACEDAAAALCAKACSCSDSCSMSYQGDDGAVGASASSDEDRCVKSLSGSCGESGTEDVTDEDYDACSADADKITCGEHGIERPKSCKF